MFVPVRFTVPPSMTRSELALDPPMAPLTVMPLLPPLSVRILPFLVSEPERVRSQLPVFSIVPVPAVTEMFRVKSPAAPV